MLTDSNPCPTIAVKDLAVSRKFYEETLGLKLKLDRPEMSLVIYNSGQGVVQVYQTDMAGTNKATYCTWEVKDIDDIANSLADAGVEFEHYEGLSDAKLEGHVHSMGDEKAAWFKDPDGNILCLHESA